MKLIGLLLLLCALVNAGHYDETYRPRRPFRQPKPHTSLPRGGRATADYQLPKDIFPIHYDIRIIPYLETSPVEKQFTFDGTLTTQLSIQVGTNKIVMHANKLNISSVDVKKNSDNSSVGVLSWDILMDDRQFFTINLDQALVTDSTYTLTIIYRGLINDDLDGFYRYSYIDYDGSLQYLAATDLEPTGSRRILPWFDEPAFKATMQTHIALEPGRNINGNMPIETRGTPVEGLEGWEWVDFVMTPPMVTYLIAFAIHKQSTIISAVDPRWQLIARPVVIDLAHEFLDLTPESIAYYDNYTGHPYMLPKLDHFSLIQFNSGGMENWGLINYREEYVIYDPNMTTTYDWQWSATLLTHEVAHMWYGDYVSPLWWSNLWLNEGFASYFECDAIQAFKSDWQLDEQFITEYLQYSMISDQRPTTHPIYANVDSPSSISNIFDSITYNKGGSIVRFMVNFLGNSQFMLGIDTYFNIMKYKSADQSDLFNVLELYAPPIPNGYTFGNMMDTWTKQAGFPLVTVTRDYATRTATIKQERFGSVGSEEWIIPLTMTNAASPNFNNQVPQAWLLPGDGTITIQSPLVPSQLEWIILNIKETGYYRVNYDETNWALIASYLASPGGVDVIAPENRAQFMNDALTLARFGRLGYNTALRTTAYLNHETRLTPWVAATDNIEYVRDRMYQTAEGIDLFQSYMRSKSNTVYNAVNGFGHNVNDSHATLLTRWTATRWSCNMNDPICNDAGAILFREWQLESNPDTSNSILPDLRTPVYCAGQRRGGLSDFNFLMARYRNAPVYSDESLRLINAMGCASDVAILNQLLLSSLTPLDGAQGDSLRALRSVSYNPVGADICLDFIIANWVQLDPIYGNIGEGFATIASVLNTQEQYDKVYNFRRDHLSELSLGALSGIQYTLDTLDETLAWNFANLAVVMDYFRSSQV